MCRVWEVFCVCACICVRACVPTALGAHGHLFHASAHLYSPPPLPPFRLLSWQGTSMAAPVVAGNAALIRQYFVNGFYPGGTQSSGISYSPSGQSLSAAAQLRLARELLDLRLAAQLCAHVIRCQWSSGTITPSSSSQSDVV